MPFQLQIKLNMTINPHFENYENLLAEVQKLDSCIELTTKEINEIGYNFKKGKVWKLTTELSLKDKVQDFSLYINFSNDFPYVLPKFFIEEDFYNSIKYIPHINHEKVVCIYDAGFNLKIPKVQLDDFLANLIYKAKRVIEKGINNPEDSLEEFIREFKAYWGGSYVKKDKPLTIGLQSIEEGIESPKVINGLRFPNSFQSQYHYFISDTEQDFQAIISYAKKYEIPYNEIKVFVINNPFDKPPYHLSYFEALQIIKKEKKIYHKFKSWLNSESWENILVIFNPTNGLDTNYYGWSYKPLKLKQNGFRRMSKSQLMKTQSIGKNQLVTRIIFDKLNQNRLQKRTTGYLESQKSCAVTGLGSVGSNLVFFLKNLPINKFHLIDNENLSVDNIKRHLLGFSNVNFSKASGVEKYLLDFLPLIQTSFRGESIGEVLLNEPNFIDECDFHIVALGNSNLEELILNNIKEKKLTKPTFFFWVEPFLASGQMLYVLPKDVDATIELIKEFPYHVIDPSENQNNKTYLIEGGCQTGYFPYSSSLLLQFLTAVFPMLKSLIIDTGTESKVISWIGDKFVLDSQKINLSKFGSTNNSFSIIEFPIV